MIDSALSTAMRDYPVTSRASPSRRPSAAGAATVSRSTGRRADAGREDTQRDEGREPFTEIDLLKDSLGYTLKRAQVRSYEMLFELLGPNVLSPGRMTALSIVGTEDGINQSSLAERLGITRPSVFKVIDALEALGLMERRSIPND